MRVDDRGERAGRGLAVGDVEHEPSRVRCEELLERLGPLAAGTLRAHLRVEREQCALQVAARHLAVSGRAEVAADGGLGAHLRVGDVRRARAERRAELDK